MSADTGRAALKPKNAPYVHKPEYKSAFWLAQVIFLYEFQELFNLLPVRPAFTLGWS